MELTRVQVIDSHTGGEPTRVVISGIPDLGRGSLAERRKVFHERCDSFRSAVINEPRGSDYLVGALLVEPAEPGCSAGVIFFNNIGTIGMCGHGTIGLAVTLAHLGRIRPGKHRLDTPVGVVGFELEGRNQATLENVPSYRHAAGVAVPVDGFGTVVGDVAWAGNWFFLVKHTELPIDRDHIEELTAFTRRIRQGLERHGITGANGGQIDHVEVFGPPRDPANHGRNFVLCPGLAYDRSPCGTGTSAKLACLFADGKLAEGQLWRQESVIGSVFEGSVRLEAGKIIPRIRGSAYITAETTLLQDPADPFAAGIR